MQLISPEYALKEINNYKEEIIIKAKIPKGEFDKRRLELVSRVYFVPLEDYASEFNSIKKLAGKFKEKYNEFLRDIDFLALALKFDIPLWTHDKLLKEQGEIKILTTKEIIDAI